MVNEWMALEQPLVVTAETDHDAVGFYRTYGFSIHSLGEKYAGVERFSVQVYPPFSLIVDQNKPEKPDFCTYLLKTIFPALLLRKCLIYLFRLEHLWLDFKV